MAYDVGTGVSGGITGAATGFASGGPPGAVIGGIVGLTSGLFKKKKQKKKKPISTLDPQQQQLYNEYISSLRGEGPHASLFNYDSEAANANFEKNVGRPAYRQFEENIIPGITGQFRKANIGQSSYTGEALSRAGRDVQENLDALRSDMQFQGQQQANQNKQNAINQILNMQTTAQQKPGPQQPSTIDQILNTLGPASGDLLADLVKNYNKPSTPTTPAAPAASPVA